MKDLALPEDMLTFVNYPTRFDCRDTLAALRNTNITCPNLHDYAWRIWDYWERHLDPALHIDRSLRGTVGGKVVLVTGGSSGIGLSAACKFAEAGATTIICARGEDQLVEAKKEILAFAGKGAKVFTYSVDITDAEGCASLVKTLEAEHGLGLLILDYLQLATGEGDSRNSQIEGITRGLKALAKELEIPIIALSQLSRNCESRPNKRPMLSDLRESGAIEQDADIVLMCYRDEYYNPNSPDAGTAEIIVAKNRQGSTGMARFAYIAPQTRFESLDSSWHPAPVEQPFAQKNRKGFSA